MLGPKVDVKIDSLLIGGPEVLYSRPEAPDAETATVAFGGSLPDMQIVSSKLCPTTGFPVVESKPSWNYRRFQWAGQRHLTLDCSQQQHLEHSRGSKLSSAWSGDLPEIIEITVRYRDKVGTGFLILHRLESTQEIPLQSEDWEDAKLKVRVTLHNTEEYTDESAPSVAECSTESSGSFSHLSFSLYTANLKHLLRGHPVLTKQETQDAIASPNASPMAPTTTTATCSMFNWEQLRLAVAACNPVSPDDLSTIATRDSWGEF